MALHEIVLLNLLSLEILYGMAIFQIIAVKVFAEEIFHSLINRSLVIFFALFRL